MGEGRVPKVLGGRSRMQLVRPLPLHQREHKQTRSSSAGSRLARGAPVYDFRFQLWSRNNGDREDGWIPTSSAPRPSPPLPPAKPIQPICFDAFISFDLDRD